MELHLDRFGLAVVVYGLFLVFVVTPVAAAYGLAFLAVQFLRWAGN